MTEQEQHLEIAKLAVEFRKSHHFKNKDDVMRARVLLFVAIDQMEADRESRRSAQESAGSRTVSNGSTSDTIPR